MILYRSIVKLYMQSAYSSSLSDVIRSGPSTKSKEVLLIMIMGAPFIAGALLKEN
jgi:hypothetical protein